MGTDIGVKDSEKEQANQSSKLKETKKNKSLSKLDKANRIVWIAVVIVFTVSFVSAYIYANDIELPWDSWSKTYRKIDDRVDYYMTYYSYDHIGFEHAPRFSRVPSGVLTYEEYSKFLTTNGVTPHYSDPDSNYVLIAYHDICMGFSNIREISLDEKLNSAYIKIVYDIESRTHTIITSGQLVEVQIPKFVETASINIVNMSED